MESQNLANRAEGYAQRFSGTYGKFDSVNSSFRWDIYLRPEHRKGKRKFICGYSKGIDTPENEDLTYVLETRLLKNIFLQNQYCKKSEKIEVFENVAGQRGEKIFTLFADDFEANPEIMGSELEDALVNIYELKRNLENKKPLSKMFGKSKKREAQTKYNPTGQNTPPPTKTQTTEEHLITQSRNCTDAKTHARIIARMRKNEIAPGLIDTLKREFKERTAPKPTANIAENLAQKFGAKNTTRTHTGKGSGDASNTPVKTPKRTPNVKNLQIWAQIRENVKTQNEDFADSFLRLRFGFVENKKLVLFVENTNHGKEVRELQKNPKFVEILQKLLVTISAENLGFRVHSRN